MKREHTYEVMKEGDMVEETESERLQKEEEIIALVLPRPAPFTWSVPGRKPGTSTKVRIGMLNASKKRTNRAAYKYRVKLNRFNCK